MIIPRCNKETKSHGKNQFCEDHIVSRAPDEKEDQKYNTSLITRPVGHEGVLCNRSNFKNLAGNTSIISMFFHDFVRSSNHGFGILKQIILQLVANRLIFLRSFGKVSHIAKYRRSLSPSTAQKSLMQSSDAEIGDSLGASDGSSVALSFSLSAINTTASRIKTYLSYSNHDLTTSCLPFIASQRDTREAMLSLS